MDHPRSAFGGLAGRAGPRTVRLLARHEQSAGTVRVRARPPRGGATSGPAEPDPRWPLEGDWFAALPRRVLIALVRVYRLLLSPWLGNQCRFEPTCSVYALQALETHGALGGSYLAARRVLRCNPWCDGGCDPVPPRLFPTRTST